MPAGLCKKKVSGENSDPGIEAAVDGGHTTPRGRFIHDIVMHQ